jgi:hypothetical protein
MTWKEINDRRKKHIRYGERLFYKLERGLASQFKQQAEKATSTEQIEAMAERFRGDLDIGEVFETFHRRVGMEFARSTFKQLKMQTGQIEKKDLNTDRIEFIWEEQILEFVRTRLGDNIASITRSMYQDILRATKEGIKKGVDGGWGIERIANQIVKEQGEIAKWRAMRIARTEVVSASNQGSLIGARDSGVEQKKVWVSVLDNRTRVYEGPMKPFDHWEMDGVSAEMEDPFIVSGEELMYPGDPAGSAGNVINCRCGIIFEPKDNSYYTQIEQEMIEHGLL